MAVGYYDPNKDYSKAISEAKAAGKDTSKLEAERQNKIDDKYGGKEPNMIGSNQKFSDVYNGGTSSNHDTSSNNSTFNGITYTKQEGTGVYGVPIINSEQKNYKQGGVTYRVGADMSRRPELANKIAISNGYTVFYDENGYATKAVKGSVDYTPNQDINAGNGTYNTNGAWTDNEMLSQSQLDLIQSYRDAAAAGTMTWADANAKANAIRAGYGYTIDNQGNVTNSGALTAVNDRREQLGLPVNGEDAYAQYYRYLMGTDTSPLAQASGNVQTLEQFLSNGGLTGSAAIPSQALVSGGNQAGGISSLEYGAGSDASQYIRDMFANQQAAQLAALKSTYEQNVLDYQAQDDLISAEAQRQRNQAAAQNELQRMYMNEMGIMQGLNTGTTGQMALAQSAALQGNLANIGTQEAQALADNSLALAKLKAQYSAAVDQAVAQNNYELANALLDAYYREVDAAQKAEAAAREQANWQSMFDYQKQQDALDYKLALQKMNASNVEKAGPTLTYSQMVEAIDRGNLTPNVLSAYKYYMGADYGADQTTNPGTYQVDTSKLSTAGRGLWNIIKQLGDNAAAASGRVQTYLNDGRISEQEADIILKYFGY